MQEGTNPSIELLKLSSFIEQPPTKEVTFEVSSPIKQTPISNNNSPNRRLSILRPNPSQEFGRPAELDKLGLDKVIQRALMGEKDWYYLENRIRQHMHDMM